MTMMAKRCMTNSLLFFLLLCILSTLWSVQYVHADKSQTIQEKSTDNAQLSQGNDLNSLKIRAEQGDADAQYILGVMYDNGEGVPQNEQEAMKWWHKAAEQGVAEAQFRIGWAYDFGDGVTEDKQ